MINRVKTGETCHFTFVFDKDSADKINSISQIAIVITTGSRYTVLRENDDSTMDIFTEFVAPDNSTFPGSDGYVKFDYAFAEEGRYDVKLCYVKDGNTALDNTDDDTPDKVFSKTKDDNMIEIVKIAVNAYNSKIDYEYEENITKEILEDKGV
jgi:hypothetical protein